VSLRKIAFFFCCSFVSLTASAQPRDYLDKSLLSLPTNGSKVLTPKPLAPYTSYRIRVTSPYNLRPVYPESRDKFKTDIVIDGKSFKAISLDLESDGHLGSIEFLYRGLGKPIYIGFEKDHHQEIESAHIEIYVEGWLAGLWREEIGGNWRDHTDWIAAGIMLVPIITSLGVYFVKRRQKIKALERREKREQQALILNTQNKRLEIIKEIDKRAQQRAQEIIARHYEELQKKVLYWRARAYTESYFLNPDLRQNFAIANRDRIISELEGKWSKEVLEIAQDLQLAKTLREQEPGVMHWIYARQEVVSIAHQLAWTGRPVVDAYFEEVPNYLKIVDAGDLDGTEIVLPKKAHYRT
jgi:hypothetical protein